MKILVCGDSWSEGWGVEKNEVWHSYLGHEIINVAKSGSCNDEISKAFLDNYDNSIDIVVVGWSGATRIPRSKILPQHPHTHLNEFSLVDKETIKFFKNMSLTDILEHWQQNIEQVLNKTKVPVIHFNIFGDLPIKKYKNFIEIGFMEYLANQQGVFFQYNIPIFEFDWLNATNYKLTNSFGKKYFNKHWKKACVEREVLRPGEMFLPCGHPTAKGHKVWGTFMKDIVNDVLNK